MVQATSPAAVRSLLKLHDLAPRKGLGQHFLWQRQVVERMAEAAELQATDLALEIGPGLGILTAACAERSGMVIAVEIDAALLTLLETELREYPNLRLVHGDARKVDFRELARRLAPDFTGCKILGNLPYYLTSPLLVSLLTGGLQPSLMVLMVQQEVAARIVAAPGGKVYGALSVLVQYYAVPELLFTVAPHDFWPQPEVTSAVIRLRIRPQPAVAVSDPALFFQVVRSSFRYRRKTLKNALSEAGLLTAGVADELFAMAGIDGGRRGETLNLAEFACLTEAVAQARERKAADALH